MKNLRDAQRLLEQGRLSEAVGFLQAILTAAEDYFFQPDRSRPTRLSLKTEAQRLLGQMPEEARQMYEIRYGPQARQLLRQAVAEGDPEKLSEISRTFYHTEAGYEASLLLGLHHLRSGRVLAAALVLDRLQKSCTNPGRLEPTLSLALATAWYRAKMPEQAQAVLVRLKASHGGKPLQLAGREAAWFGREKDVLAWLAQWAGNPALGGPSQEDAGYLMVRNSPGRNAASSGGRPLLNLRWRVPTADHPLLDQWIQRLQQDLEDQGVPCVAQGIPLAVGDTVLLRSVQNLVAVDVQTGKRRWESPVAAPVDTILAGQDQPINLGQATVLQARMAQRIWLDATYSRLSSDGKLVFCIEEDSGWGAPTPGVAPQMQILIIRQRMKEGRRSSPANRLAAYDIRTGKLQWEVGGPEDQEYALPLAGTAFLGAPLPLMGQLYVLGETRNDVRLLVLEAQTGRLLWSQQLGVVGQEGGPNFDMDGQPFTGRFLGLSPSYAEGILVCPTGQGALVALDLASRTFLWAYAYLPQMEAGQRRMILIQQMAFAGQMAPAPSEGWMETTCMLADGRVLLTTPESRDIYCLNLADGKELWKQTCPDGLYVACVHDGKVVWVGRHRVGAFRLADGQPAWPVGSSGAAVSAYSSAALRRNSRLENGMPGASPDVPVLPSGDAAAVAPEVSGRLALDLPDGAVPSGLGFLSGDKYYLPLSTGEVATVDLSKGEIVHRSRSRTGAVPGNLICVRDKVISQSPSGVELYEQLEPLKSQTEARLAQNPNDPDALAIRGEILLEEGRRAEAIEAFQRSLAQRADPRTQQFLRETLFEGLQEDFVAYRRHLPELEKLLDSEEHRARYERLLAEGLLQAGEYASAWQTYQRLAERKEPLARLEQISKSYAVRRDRWFEDQWGQFRRKAPPELVQQMDRQIQEQLEKVLGSSDPIGGLVQFVNLYGEHPSAERARQELLTRLVSGGRWLEAELLLREQARSEDSAKKRSATAQLADLLRRAGRPAEAAVYYQQLAEQWADEVCLDGKTGKQIVQSLAQDDPVRRCLQPSQWPQGRVQVQRSPVPANSATLQVAYHGRFFLSTENITDPTFQDAQIVFDQNRRLLLGYDRFGRELWKPFPISFGNNPNRFFGFNRSWWQVYLQGRLMVISTGTSLQAYDLMGISGGEGPRMLWSQDLLEAGRLGNEEEGIVLAAFPAMPWRQMPGRPGSTTIRLVSDRVMCFQRLRHLMAVDTLTGQPLWVRSDLPAGCALFGDEKRLFVLPPDKADMLVLHPRDGKLIEKRPLPKLGSLADGPPVPGQVFPPGVPGQQAADVAQAAMPQMLRQYCLTAIGGRLLLCYGEGDKQSLRLYDLWEQKDVWGPIRFPLGTRTALVEKEAVGLLEPNGQFTLVRIADGQVVVQDKLNIREIAESLQGMHLMRLGDLYLVTPFGIPQGFQHMPQQPIPGMHCGQVPFGRVYAYSLEGKRLWAEPLELRQQNMLFSQPAGLPVVIFATQQFERRNQGGGTFHVQLLVIHKQTGRKLLEEKFPYTTNIFQITGDPEKHTVDILLQRDKTTLTFTDQPWPAEEEASANAASAKEKEKGATKKPSTLREGLWRSIRKTFLPEEPPNPFEEFDSEVQPAIPAQAIPLPAPVPVPQPDTR